MAFIDKIAFRKCGGSDRGRKRPKKSNTANPSFFLNNSPLPVFSLILPPTFPLMPPPLPSPVPPFLPPLISFPFLSNSSAVTPLIPFSNPFYDTRP